MGGDQLSAAWAGGADGREVVDRLFPVVPSLLSPKGRFYLLVLKENLLLGTERKSGPRPSDPCPMPQLTKSKFFHLSSSSLTFETGDVTKAIPGYTARTVLERRAGRERLSVLCYERAGEHSDTLGNAS